MKKLFVLIFIITFSFGTAYAGRLEVNSSEGQIIVSGEADTAYETVKIIVLPEEADINEAIADGSDIIFAGFAKSSRDRSFAVRFKPPASIGAGVYKAYAGMGSDVLEEGFYYESAPADTGEFPAGDNTLSAEINLNMNTVTLSGNTAAGNTVTCMVLKPGYSADEADEEAICFAGQTAADSEGKYRISFDMDIYQPSGYYTAVVSGNAVRENVTGGFDFVGFREAGQLVASVNTAVSGAEVFALMEGEDAAAALGLLGCFAEDYAKLSEEQRKAVCDIVYNNGTDYTDEAAQYNSFRDCFNEAVVITEIEGIADAENMEMAVRKYASYLGLDFGDNTLISNASAPTRADIFSMLIKKTFENKDKLARAVNEAELIGLIKNANHSAAEGIISYYKSLLQLEVAEYEELADKTYVNKLLVSKDYTQKYSSAESFSNSVTKAVEEYRKYLSGQTSGGGGGGGGGSASGGIGGVYIPEAEEPPKKKSFSDLEGFEWARSSIEALADLKAAAGDEKGNFNPKANVTREEFVKMVVTAFGVEQSSADAGFSDSDQSKWYYPYINTAFAHGIVKGISDNEFGAGQDITRQDIAVILSRMIELEDGGAQVFADDASIADYAKASVYSMRAGGIISGRGGNCFAPAEPASRAEAAVMIYNSLQYKSKG